MSPEMWSVPSDASASSGGSRQHSTMPTYNSQHPKAPPLAVRHSSSLELPRPTRGGEKLTPREFLDKFSLPRVVQVVGDGCSLGPLTQPLLLYRQYKSTKVQARSVASPKGGRPVGPSLVVPDSYQGWFSLLTAQGQQTAQVFNTVSQVVAARISTFLTKNEMTAFRLNERRDAGRKDFRRQQYAKTPVAAGQVLRVLGVFEDERGRRLLLGRSGFKKYAQCVSLRGHTLFVPLSTTGCFYGISGQDVAPEAELAMLQQMPQLLRDFRLPLVVRLVSGVQPTPLPMGFTGNLLLESYQQEDVILACTLPSDAALRMLVTTSSEQPRLLEIDADSRFLLSRPLFSHDSESRLFKSPILQGALTFCRDRGDTWRRQIKVTHHVLPVGCKTRVKKPLNDCPKQPRKKQVAITKTSTSCHYKSPGGVGDGGVGSRQLLEEVPYNRVADDIGDFRPGFEENIYAEIRECDVGKRHTYGKANAVNGSDKDDYYYYVQFGDGGSDGTYSGTNLSNPEDEPTYDTVC